MTADDLGDPNDPSDDTVTVQNPWYGDQPLTLPYENWKNGFKEVARQPRHVTYGTSPAGLCCHDDER